MLLLVDAGNTRIKWAIADAGAAPGDWTAHGAVPHAELERLQPAWAGQGLTRAIISNVADHAMQAQLTALLAPLRSEERRVGKECRSRWSPYH